MLNALNAEARGGSISPWNLRKHDTPVFLRSGELFLFEIYESLKNKHTSDVQTRTLVKTSKK